MTKTQEFVAPRRESLEDTIIEEGNEDEQDSKERGAPFTAEGTKNPQDVNEPQPQHFHATTELHRHEILALFACFICPLLGGWLLHAIRGQLSRPSEGLISNYNLSVFLLASEICPLAHLMRMIQARTLYLQRTVNADAHEEPKLDFAVISDLTKRIDELESYAADTSTAHSSPNAHSDLGDQIKTDVRKGLQPDLDALNRAVRRYEKKLVALTMQTESRLQDLESRMSDAITLAAAAERSTASKSGRGSPAIVLFDWVSTALLLPLQAGWTVVSFPARLSTAIFGIFENYVGNKVRKEMRTAGRAGSGQSRKGVVGSRAPKKAM